jgi:hypothetical protein
MKSKVYSPFSNDQKRMYEYFNIIASLECGLELTTALKTAFTACFFLDKSNKIGEMS